MKRLKTMANDLLELAESMEEWDKYIDKIRKPEEDGKLVAIINERNEFITKLLALDLESRFQYSERPIKAQNKWFKDNWGVSESTLDFYRNKKNKSIARQYSELDDTAKEFVVEEDSDGDCIDESISEDNNVDFIEEHQPEESTENIEVPKEDELVNKSNVMNHRSTEENPWDNCSHEDIYSLEPFHHTPYQYGDIMDDGKVFVWKGKFVDKELFFKSYTKAKAYLNKKRELKLSVSEISKRTGIPTASINNTLYYPYIKSTEMLVEQFERKYEEI